MQPSNLESAKVWVRRTFWCGVWSAAFGGGVVFWGLLVFRPREPMPYVVGAATVSALMTAAVVSLVPALVTAWFFFLHLVGQVGDAARGRDR